MQKSPTMCAGWPWPALRALVNQHRKMNRVAPLCRAKVNPTQCEAMTMLCCQVLGNDVGRQHGRCVRQFRAERLSSDGYPQCASSLYVCWRTAWRVSTRIAPGIEPNRERISQLLNESLMLVTALNTHIGYDSR